MSGMERWIGQVVERGLLSCQDAQLLAAAIVTYPLFAGDVFRQIRGFSRRDNVARSTRSRAPLRLAVPTASLQERQGS